MLVASKSFPKNEHLCGEKRVDALFQQSASFVCYPLRVLWKIEPPSGKAVTDVKVLVSVSKRKLKRAVDRNHVKRLVREAYRLNKHVLFEGLEPGVGLQIAFIWIPAERLMSVKVQQRMKTTLLRILTECTTQQLNHAPVETSV